MIDHADVARLAVRLAEHAPSEASPWPEARLAAVVAVLRVRDEPELLFIKRAEAEHDPWSGHVAFPGGRREPADDSLQVTAIRETCEELALKLTAESMLGQLDDLAPRSHALPPIIIRPFVALVASDVSFVLSREVASVFWVPLSALRAAEAQIEHAVMINGVTARFPAYAVQGHVVWGLTERIVRQLLSMFEVPA
ncbi:MAG: CoA pyrophosphatase [Gemmatimonadaceae bacterium]|nr:CoA pyrophosphatase [Gemmatimonadaceae bacterium]